MALDADWAYRRFCRLHSDSKDIVSPSLRFLLPTLPFSLPAPPLSHTSLPSPPPSLASVPSPCISLIPTLPASVPPPSFLCILPTFSSYTYFPKLLLSPVSLSLCMCVYVCVCGCVCVCVGVCVRVKQKQLFEACYVSRTSWIKVTQLMWSPHSMPHYLNVCSHPRLS